MNENAKWKKNDKKNTHTILMKFTLKKKTRKKSHYVI